MVRSAVLSSSDLDLHWQKECCVTTAVVCGYRTLELVDSTALLLDLQSFDQHNNAGDRVNISEIIFFWEPGFGLFMNEKKQLHWLHRLKLCDVTMPVAHIECTAWTVPQAWVDPPLHDVTWYTDRVVGAFWHTDIDWILIVFHTYIHTFTITFIYIWKK